MSQRYEKLAQRRVEERNEKLKSALKTRFDIRLNPFFSRPLEGTAKEFVRQQQQQEQEQQQKQQHSVPTHSIIFSGPNEQTTPYTQFHNHTTVKKSKKLRYSTDDDESGLRSRITTTTTVSEPLRRPVIKSRLARPISTMTDATMIRSIENLKLIYPPINKTKYQHLCLIDQIASIYIQLVVTSGYKTMTSGQFRNFSK
jgi:hypothetical protein